MRFVLVAALGATVATPMLVSRSDDKAPAPAKTEPARPTGPLTPVDITAVQNALKWSDNIYSGSCPVSEAGYKALAARGIKTIVTVDGAQPDVEIAHKYGLRYVHIPVEYSGITRVDAIRIIRAVRDLPGPVFIHCHHGLHRSPAATALVAIALANFDNQKAHAALVQAGTGLNYKGLWKNVDEFKAPAKAEIDAADASFPERAKLPGIQAAMVKIDGYFDHLKAFATTNWASNAAQPDLDPAHEALLLREGFTELSREPHLPGYNADFWQKMEVARSASELLEVAIRDKDNARAADALGTVKASCANCHSLYRDVKPG